MKKSLIFLLVFILVGSTLAGMVSAKNVSTPQNNEPADLILKNGDVYTSDKNNSTAKTIAVRDGKIVYVGNNNSVMSLKGPDTKVVDLKGKMLLPGFIDTHNHAYLKAEELFWVTLTPYKTVAEYGQAIKAYVAEHPGIEQVRGVGWNEDMVKKEAEAKGVSQKELLDQYVSDLPVVIISNGHHDLWVNSKALENAGVDENTPNPQGGLIDRINGTNEPNGVLHDFSAQNLIIEALPQPDFTVEEYEKTILAFQEMSAERGVTSVFVPVHYPTEPLLQAYDRLDEAGQLTVRYDLGLWADETKGTAQVQTLVDMRSKYKGEMFKIDTIKIFGDGDGGAVWDQDVLNETVAALDQKGFRIYVHAFAEGVDDALEAFAFAAEQNGARDARHVITHAVHPSEEQILKYQQLNVIPVPQPGSRWGTGMMNGYFEAGLPVAASSDYPVSDFWPLVGVEDGMTRPALEERASLQQMLTSYSINAAQAIFAEDVTGSIEVGKNADLVVLEKDLFDLPVEEISETKTLMTLFNGEIVYTNPSFTN